jgi:hypothetical protein
MIYKLLDTVVLDRDLPEQGLRNTTSFYQEGEK